MRAGVTDFGSGFAAKYQTGDFAAFRGCFATQDGDGLREGGGVSAAGSSLDSGQSLSPVHCQDLTPSGMATVELFAPQAPPQLPILAADTPALRGFAGVAAAETPDGNAVLEALGESFIRQWLESSPAYFKFVSGALGMASPGVGATTLQGLRDLIGANADRIERLKSGELPYTLSDAFIEKHQGGIGLGYKMLKGLGLAAGGMAATIAMMGVFLGFMDLFVVFIGAMTLLLGNSELLCSSGAFLFGDFLLLVLCSGIVNATKGFDRKYCVGNTRADSLFPSLFDRFAELKKDEEIAALAARSQAAGTLLRRAQREVSGLAYLRENPQELLTLLTVDYHNHLETEKRQFTDAIAALETRQRDFAARLERLETQPDKPANWEELAEIDRGLVADIEADIARVKSGRLAEIEAELKGIAALKAKIEAQLRELSAIELAQAELELRRGDVRDNARLRAALEEKIRASEERQTAIRLAIAKIVDEAVLYGRAEAEVARLPG